MTREDVRPGDVFTNAAGSWQVTRTTARRVYVHNLGNGSEPYPVTWCAFLHWAKGANRQRRK